MRTESLDEQRLTKIKKGLKTLFTDISVTHSMGLGPAGPGENAAPVASQVNCSGKEEGAISPWKLVEFKY